MLLSCHYDEIPLKCVYLNKNQWISGGTGCYSALGYLAAMSSVFVVIAALVIPEYALLIYPAISFTLICMLRNVVVGVRRKWRGKGRRTNRDWIQWLEHAQMAQSVDKLPLFDRGSLAQVCLAASLPKDGRAQQYEFAEPSDAAEFCNRHRHIIVQRLRSSFSEQQGERLLAIGILETKEGECLLIFRQISDECALFFAVTHRRNGTVVNLITQRWALYNRDAAPQEGRKKSDEEIAAKRGVPDQQKWRAKPEWGALGYWHLVDCICHKMGGDGETPTPKTSAADSELDYYDKIIHVETVKESQQKQSTGLGQTQSPRKRDDGKPSSTQDFL